MIVVLTCLQKATFFFFVEILESEDEDKEDVLSEDRRRVGGAWMGLVECEELAALLV